MFRFLNNRGLSLPELMVSLGIAGVIALGGTKILSNMERNKYEMVKHTDYLGLEKVIEGFLISPKGCKALENKAIGNKFSFKLDPKSSVIYEEEKFIGDIEITGLKVDSFVPMNAEGDTGVAQVELKLLKKNSKRGLRRIIPVAVSVENNIIQSCNHDLALRYQDITNTLCAETYNLPEGTSCEQALVLLRNAAVENICTDLYGSKSPQYITDPDTGLKHCNLDLIHAGQTCNNRYVQGFNGNGRRVCGSYALEPNPEPIAPDAACPTVDPKSWSGKCSGKLAGVASGSSSTATNTKVGYTGSATYACSDGAWSLTSKSCDAIVAKSCPTVDPKEWGSNCSGVLNGVDSGSTSTANNTVTGYNGSATYKCNDGNWAYETGSCGQESGCGTINLKVVWHGATTVNGTLTCYGNESGTFFLAEGMIRRTSGGSGDSYGDYTWECTGGKIITDSFCEGGDRP